MHISEAMTMAGMTRYRLSKTSGIPWATLSDICSGRTDLRRCTAETVLKLSKALGMTMEDVLELETGGDLVQLPSEDDEYVPELESYPDLPKDLQKAIDDYERMKDDPRHIEDCLIDEIAGSINANLHSGTISPDVAASLFEKYVYGN